MPSSPDSYSVEQPPKDDEPIRASSEELSSGEVRYFEKKVIFDGVCDHFYEDRGDDGEGRRIAKCQKCPMGRLYLAKKEKIATGKFVPR